ncbi:MAG TPA: 4Fe-4S dicluster domain-containing protein [Syntrophorhabdales bacterium]|nr:4Fe-4S dicluster domain-containing protein [Syntrophorhabdales bacterium]
MQRTPGIMVIEPSSEQGKRRAAGIFSHKDSYLDQDAIKANLKEIRTYAKENHASLLDQLKNSLGQYSDIKVTFAENATSAAVRIREIAGATTLASMNKSNVVVNELRPELRAMGFQTYLRYFTEFNNFDIATFKKKVEDYWAVPGMHGRGLVESFGVARQFNEISSSETRDYVAVLGVNAASAQDGTLYFLQHMSNISKDLEQARKIIFVVSIEKVLKDKEAALFHTRSMGIFGLESVLLDLDPNPAEVYNFDSLPLLSGDGRAREVHLIILDNGRTALLNNGYEELFLCIDCRACARQCPIAKHLMVERQLVYSPKNYVLSFLQGKVSPLDECLHCGRCEVECPVAIDVPTLVWKTQIEYYQKHGRSLKKRLLDDPEILAKLGSLTAPLANWAGNLPIVKRIMELTAGIHHQANLPTFHRRTFRDWFKGGPRG